MNTFPFSRATVAPHGVDTSLDSHATMKVEGETMIKTDGKPTIAWARDYDTRVVRKPRKSAIVERIAAYVGK